MKLEDYETRMVHDGKRNNREVKIQCEWCRKFTWTRWQRVREGRGRFCSLECYGLSQRKWGKENATFYWDETRQCWYAYWIDKETGSQKSTTRARFLWEQKYGELQSNEVVTYIDGNPKNCELDNLEMMSRSDWNKIHLIGHDVSEETKQKLSDVHSGKELSDEHKLSIGNSVRRRWASGEFDNIHVGENSKLWRGGVDTIYPQEFNEELKMFIRNRDNHKCKLCKSNETEERAFPVHHIDGNKNNNEHENLLTVCYECHGHIHGKHDYNDPVILAFRSMLNP